MDLNWVGTQLLVERAGARISREVLAERSGVSLSTIRRIEEGERSGTISQFEHLCKALGLAMSTFFARAEERRKAMVEEYETHQQVADIFDAPSKRASPKVPNKAARNDRDPDA